MLLNYGILGDTYAKDSSGKITFTDKVLKNPNNIPLNAGIHIFRVHNGVPSYRYGSLSNPIPLMRSESQVIRKMWTCQSESKDNLPPISYTAEEGSKKASIQSNLDAYRDEMIVKFITGKAPISGFDEYVAKCKALGTDDDIAIVQRAYDRYMSRK